MELYHRLREAWPFFVIAGPCVVEDKSTMRQVAEHLCGLCDELDLPLVFKASYRKANRSSGASPSGPGLEEGLKCLQELKREFGFPVLTDVHECQEVAATAQVCDILQIPAFLSRQTSLIEEVARSGRIVNIKKGQFMAPEDVIPAAIKAKNAGNDMILLTERGSSFGYHDLVVDFRGFAQMAVAGYPVVYDVTHSLQRPSLGQVSGGGPQYAAMMARAAIATGKVSGLFIETHPQPSRALSDAASMLPLNELRELLTTARAVREALKETNYGRTEQ